MPSSNSTPPSCASNAIHSGADLILALFEEETKRREDINLEKLNDLEARFRQFRGHTALGYAKIALKAQVAEAELAKTKEELSRVSSDNIEAHARSEQAEAVAAQTMGHLDALKFSLRTFGLVCSDDLVLKHDDKTAEAISKLFDFIGGSGRTLPRGNTTIRSVISFFSQFVEFHKNSAKEWEEKHCTLERERDLAIRVLSSLPIPSAAARAEQLAPQNPSSPQVEPYSLAKVLKSENSALSFDLLQEPPGPDNVGTCPQVTQEVQPDQ